MIASFDDSFVATYREDVKLPCLTVGVPAPEISWKVKGAPLESNDRIRQLPEGSLLIRSVTRTDAGEYSCFVENSFGKDKITHHIVVLGIFFINYCKILNFILYINIIICKFHSATSQATSCCRSNNVQYYNLKSKTTCC